MNQLKRIILINSGAVDFFELQLDGNIHLIGNQGTGKSTVLRAILFFYNAEARKLGISKEKLPFNEYYFPHADSYIIYEVTQEHRSFCVWLYKKQNRLCFRFIDGAYDRELFIEKQSARTESQIIEISNQKGYKVHHPIYNFTEYRDIIYGANKSLNRFSILQNPGYQNIPRTISNIFLNSSLDGGFIKTTIINSLSDESFEINLDTNRHHIETARNDYRDVSEYLNQEKKAHKIVSLYEDLLKMGESKKEISWGIGASYNLAKEKQQFEQEEQGRLKRQEEDQKEKISKIKEEFTVNQRRIQDKLSVVKSDISKANQKEREYKTKNIEQILDEHSKKGEYQSEQSQIQAQLNLLTADMKDIENQYQLDKQRLEYQCQQQILDYERSQAESKEKWNQDLSNLKNLFYREKEQIGADYSVKLAGLQNNKVCAEGKIKEIDYKIENLRNQTFYRDEQENLIRREQELKQEKQGITEQKSRAQIQKEGAVKEGEREMELLEFKTSQENEKLVQKKESVESEIVTLKAELQAIEGSLLEYLEQNRPDWINTIGKIASRELLLQNELQPSITEGDNFYGLNLTLDQLQPIRLSKSGLEIMLETSNNELTSQLNNIQKYQQSIQDQKDKIQKKLNKKISDFNQEIRECTYQEEKKEVELEKCLIVLKEIKEKAELKKRQYLEEKEKEKQRLSVELKEIDEIIKDTILRNQKTISELESQQRVNIKKVKSQLDDLAERIVQGKKVILDTFNAQLITMQEQRILRLEEKGSDIYQIKLLDDRWNSVKDKLKEIEKNYPLIIEYYKDRNDYIDRLDEFRRERKTMENDLEHLQQLYTSRINKETGELKELNDRLGQISNNLKEMKYQVDAYDRFSKSQLFEELRNFVEHQNKAEQWNCDEFIGKLQNLALEYEKSDKSFTERITEFTGYFNPQNCLGFEINLSGPLQYRAFAENLKEFVREQKIIDFKTEVTRKYAMVLANIVNETNELLQKEDDVQKVIVRINMDFRKSNFVGVVKSIEMRLQESSNKIIQLLRKIRRFQVDNAFHYGEINLFNQGDSTRKDSEAVKLLENLLSQIGQAKTKLLSLEDAFDLEFRIRENENDTNWVNRLANVGSNGTDVLVKSMIYINLLHIFKSNGSKQKSDAILHCLIDEVGILHDSNVSRLINFASERNIRLINGSPNSHNEQDYKHIYIFRKNPKSNKTGITKLISNEL